METTIDVRNGPILFTGEMVRAILDDRKTKTRRVVQFPKSRDRRWNLTQEDWRVTSYGDHLHITLADGAPWGTESGRISSAMQDKILRCPYGKPGDHLYVRESAWMDSGKTCAAFAEEPNRYISKFNPGVIQRARIGHRESTKQEAEEGFREHSDWRKVPSIHVPKWAFRIQLEVTGVRVERVQEITADDARAEGVTGRMFAEALRSLADRADPLAEYWIDSYEPSFSYCYDCGRRKVGELNAALGDDEDEHVLDGGYGSESDGPRFCETCEAHLNVCFTDYGAEEELRAAIEYGIDSPISAYDMRSALNAGGWPIIDELDCTPKKIKDLVARAAFRHLWDSINAGRGYSWESNPYVWVVEFRRLSN